ncbi:hypothetical protein AVEN_275073-1 [Araneus ventricosus]|uniref:Uncharacterized protein n=1 Tax=Araneus ventricosus TaxID=182803 RepID=A0A4Y2R6T5_ARAVE|nr:hypothetical protein AVEN_275073-1 [Araneus ventricosus]
MVDGNKLIREKAKVRKDLEFQALSEAQALPLKGLYFDGREDSALVEERVDTKRYARKAKENVYVLLKKYLSQDLKDVVDGVICRNSFFPHPENILLCMLKYELVYIRELAARRIIKSREYLPM